LILSWSNLSWQMTHGCDHSRRRAAHRDGQSAGRQHLWEVSMNLNPRIVGAAGILAGVGLAVEGVLFMTSGWTAETFADAHRALAFLNDSGTQLRAAVFAGAINLVLAAVFVVGLADRLQTSAPTRAATTLYLGVIGIAGESLIPLGLWLGVPTFVDLAARDPQAAAAAWNGYAASQAAAGAVGGLFLGLSTLAAGWAIASKRPMPALLGWLAIVAGAASVLTVLAAQTPLAPVATAAYLPSLTLVIAFRIWGGIELWRGRARAVAAPRPNEAVTPDQRR
jgi:hypothetical protein